MALVAEVVEPTVDPRPRKPRDLFGYSDYRENFGQYVSPFLSLSLLRSSRKQSSRTRVGLIHRILWNLGHEEASHFGEICPWHVKTSSDRLANYRVKLLALPAKRLEGQCP